MKYYSTQRPITLGSYPKPPFNEVLQVVNFDAKIYCEEINREAWGFIEYKEPLHPEYVIDYELTAIPLKIKEVVFVNVDSCGRRVYEDKNGKLWKYTEPGEMPVERHDRLHSSTNNTLDGEPCWPMMPDMDYQINESERKITMISREKIISELTNRGYEVESHTSIRNGVEFNGIRFKNENGIHPVVYTDDIIADSESLYEVTEKVLEAYNNADSMDFDKKKLLDPNFVMENLYIGLQKTSNEDIVKTETTFKGIEQYLYVRMNEDASFKLTYGLLEYLKVSKEKVWEAAENNTFAKTEIVSFVEELSELIGQEMEEIEDIPIQYIVTNAMNFRGASAILDRKELENLAQKLGVKRFYVLPSSIHEMLIIPENGSINIDELSMMVKEVNRTQVAPEERLTDRAYVMEI